MCKGNSYKSKSNCCETYGILCSERFLDASGGLLAMRQHIYGDGSQNNFSIGFKGLNLENPLQGKIGYLFLCR